MQLIILILRNKAPQYINLRQLHSTTIVVIIRSFRVQQQICEFCVLVKGSVEVYPAACPYTNVCYCVCCVSCLPPERFSYRTPECY